MSGLDTGSLNRLITIERKIATQGVMSAGAAIYELHAMVWAEVRDVLPSRAERVAEGITIGNRPARIRMRWRGDITSDMRIIHGTRAMQIIAGPAEIGRREGLELMAEDYSTAGTAA